MTVLVEGLTCGVGGLEMEDAWVSRVFLPAWKQANGVRRPLDKGNSKANQTCTVTVQSGNLIISIKLLYDSSDKLL